MIREAIQNFGEWFAFVLSPPMHASHDWPEVRVRATYAARRRRKRYRRERETLLEEARRRRHRSEFRRLG